MAHLEVDVVHAGARADLHLLHTRGPALLARLLCLLLLRVAELAVVHDPADRRVRRGRDLDQVELALLREAKRLLRGDHPELRPIGADDTYLAGADLPVHPDLVLDLGYDAPPGMRASATVRAMNASSGSAASAAPSRRGATAPDAASRSPTTAMTGIFSSCALIVSAWRCY